jgi:hypothetical protein
MNVSYSQQQHKLAETIPHTSDVRARKWARNIDLGALKKPSAKPHADTLLPALNVEALRERFRPDKAHLPIIEQMHWRVPIEHSPYDTGESAGSYFEQLKLNRIRQWIEFQAKHGWIFVNQKFVFRTDDGLNRTVKPIFVVPGEYPARDTENARIPWVGHREYVAVARFRKHNPQPQRLELNPRWLEPRRVGGN